MNEKQTIPVSKLEKVVVNWATPIEAPVRHWLSYIKPDQYEHSSIKDRFLNMSRGRIILYKKILVEKQVNHGEIPQRVIDKNKYWPCGWTRLGLAYLRKV